MASVQAPEPAAQLRATSAAPEPAEPATWPAGPGPADPPPDIKLGATSAALTETLDRALDRLAEETAQNQHLKETVARLQQTLAEKEATIQGLQGQLEECGARIQQMEAALAGWKEDVL
ncbi:MAG: hypothetical protein ACYS1C_12840, partial [Planctomycetota bacterium]